MDSHLGGAPNLPGVSLVVSAPRTGLHVQLPRGRGIAAACWSIGLLLAVGCGNDAERTARELTSTAVPTLSEVALPPTERWAANELAAVVVGERGEVLMMHPDSLGGTMLLLGSDSVGLYGRRGEGPGEMRMGVPILVDDTTVIGFDLASRRLQVFDRASGALRREVRPTQAAIPFLRGQGGSLIASHFEAGIESPALVDLRTGRVRHIVSPADTYRIALFRDDEQMPGGSANTAVVGRWAGGVVLANGMTYRLGLYGASGELVHVIERNLPPRMLTQAEIELEMSRLAMSPMGRSPARLARAREQLGKLPVRWFTHAGPPRDDGHGRLWVVLQHGDSTAADLYVGGDQIGHLTIDCPGFGGQWDVSGEWLVLLCFPRDPAAEGDAEIRRWRIVEPAATAAVP